MVISLRHGNIFSYIFFYYFFLFFLSVFHLILSSIDLSSCSVYQPHYHQTRTLMPTGRGMITEYADNTESTSRVPLDAHITNRETDKMNAPFRLDNPIKSTRLSSLFFERRQNEKKKGKIHFHDA